MNKYRSKPVWIDGERFDSKKEANRYKELRLLERAGKIQDLRRQVRYLLIPSQYDKHGKCIEYGCSYFADFVYHENGQLVVEDTKGLKTDVYIIKRKLMLEKYGIRIRET